MSTKTNLELDRPKIAWESKEETIDPAHDQEEKENEEESETVWDILRDYAENTTIQGIEYIVLSYQTTFGKLFWTVVVISMLILGTYWSVMAYLGWKGQQVLTTITTTAYSVKQIEFPAVTFCSTGYDYTIMNSAIMKQFFGFLNDQYGITDLPTPLKAAEILGDDPNFLNHNDSQTLTRLNKYLTGDLYQDFLNHHLPGLRVEDDLLGLVSILNSKNPQISIETIARQSEFKDLLKRRTPIKEQFCLDATDFYLGYCYKADQYFPVVNIYKDQLCPFSTYPVFDSEDQAETLIKYLATDSFGILSKVPVMIFFLHGMRDKQGNFSNSITIENFDYTAGSSKVFDFDQNMGEQSLECLAAMFNISQPGKFTLIATDCQSGGSVNSYMCMMRIPPAEVPNPYDYIFDPSYEKLKTLTTEKKRLEFDDMFSRLQKKKGFDGLFSIFWYSVMPCFDVQGVTANVDGERSILKYCEWKGMQQACSEIFSTYPTDIGLCCSFNMEAAETMFNENAYQKMITSLTISDKAGSFNVSIANKNDDSLGEGTSTEPGITKGLTVILDAHSNLLAQGSVDTDSEGFVGLINPGNSFPFISYAGFEISPGQNNMIALTGTYINADDGLRSIDPVDRNCLFDDETDKMKIHKTYTQSNCFFECSIIFAMNEVKKKNNLTNICLLWFIPSPDDRIPICEPWLTPNFLEFLQVVPDDLCNHCLPDCSVIIYNEMITMVPLRLCDSSDLGMTQLCDIYNPKMIQPSKFGQQVMDKYKEVRGTVPTFVQNLFTSSKRFYNDWNTVNTINVSSYDAYDVDIAMVQVFFKTTSVIQIGSQPFMTWTDFFSAIGGLLGLVLGMTIVSFIELFWLGLRILAHKMNLSSYIM